MAAALAACGGSDTSTSGGGSAGGTPKRGGDFRLGVTGGGSKDIMDGQNIITKPDQARLVTAFETLLTFDDEYQLTTDGLAESVEAGQPEAVHDQAPEGHRVPNGKALTADDVIYSLQRIGTEANGLTGFAATATMDIKNIKKVDKYTVQLPLLTPGLDDPADARQLHLRHRPGRLRGLQRRPVDADRHRCLHAQELHAWPGERARAQPELLAFRAAVLRHGDDHGLLRRDRAGQRACSVARSTR